HRVERRLADHAQHVRDLGVVGADVARDEGVVVLERAEGGGLGHGEGLWRARMGRVRARGGASLSFCLRVQGPAQAWPHAPSAPGLTGLSRVVPAGGTW